MIQSAKSVDISKEAQLQTVMGDALVDFKINAECVNVRIHKHLAFFDLKLTKGVSGSSDISKIERRVKDFQLRVKSVTIPTVELVPDSGIIRLQACMRQADSQSLEDLYRNYTISSKMMLPMVLGECNGERLVVDFAKNPHTLIGGATFSGKSVLLHSLIANMTYLIANNARDIQIYLVDPKQVEFDAYSSEVFSKYITNVISTYDETIDLIQAMEREMESRYTLLKEWGYKSLAECPNRMSQIVIIIDEVADLMIQDKGKLFEKTIARLAAKARAAGIHMILATQRPSIDVITGLIKANFPARISCKTTSATDSRVILDSVGAENLMGRGDAFIKNMDYDKSRFQAAFSDPKVTERYLLHMSNVA